MLPMAKRSGLSSLLIRHFTCSSHRSLPGQRPAPITKDKDTTLDKRRTEFPVRKQNEAPRFVSMWSPPIGSITSTQTHCKDLLPRFDEIYYKPSNTLRCYQRTWAECPPVRQRLRKVCCLDGIRGPELRKRVKPPCPLVICSFDYTKMRHICEKAAPDPEGKCKRIHWPCCKPANCPPKCIVFKKPKICQRLKAPQKSFSEIHFHPRALRSSQCGYEKPLSCESIQEGEYRKNFNIIPACPSQRT